MRPEERFYHGITIGISETRRYASFVCMLDGMRIVMSRFYDEILWQKVCVIFHITIWLLLIKNAFSESGNARLFCIAK